MTQRQREILLIINNYIENEGISPTVREICDVSGLKSTATVHFHIKALQKEGYIKMKQGSARSIRIVKEHLY